MGKFRNAGSAEVRGVVVMERVVAPEAPPAGRLEGLNDAVASGGKFDAENVTAAGSVPP